MQEFKIMRRSPMRANGLNYLVCDSPRPRLRIIAAAKPTSMCCRRWTIWASASGTLRTSACACTRSVCAWPLEASGVRQFAEGLEEILVVEEKRQIISTS